MFEDFTPPIVEKKTTNCQTHLTTTSLLTTEFLQSLLTGFH